MQKAVQSDAVETAAFQPIAPFVIARDMARRFENQPAEVRHKALIELASSGSDSKGKLDATRESLVASLKQIARARKIREDALAVDPLQRFVAAELTREEAETLASVEPAAGRSIARIWRNSAKRALLDTSTNTIQARTANVGYSAVGRDILGGPCWTPESMPRTRHFAKFGNIRSSVRLHEARRAHHRVRAGQLRSRHTRRWNHCRHATIFRGRRGSPIA